MALAHLLAGRGAPRDLRRPPPAPIEPEDVRAFVALQVARNLPRPDVGDWSPLVREIEAFSELERRRVFHLAYKRTYRVAALDALAIHGRDGSRVANPPYQMICCIDKREESFRRHLEEIDPAAETFGAAGFFSIPMYYRGEDSAHFVPLCPIVIKPKHWVTERVIGSFQGRSGAGSCEGAPAGGLRDDCICGAVPWGPGRWSRRPRGP